ncbi:hypothetical protein ACROYT_G028893 [Oculina patagonica]
MASMFFAALLVLVSSVTIAFSLQCYKCVREDKPDADKYCEISSSSLGNNQIENCTSDNTRCIITKTVKKDSVTQFRRDCGKEEGCTNKCTDPDAEGTVICKSCCEEDLCNKGIGPKPAELSGTSRIMMIRSLYALGGFLMWLLL